MPEVVHIDLPQGTQIIRSRLCARVLLSWGLIIFVLSTTNTLRADVGGFAIIQHHCRYCGRVFCAECSKFRFWLPPMYALASVRMTVKRQIDVRVSQRPSHVTCFFLLDVGPRGSFKGTASPIRSVFVGTVPTSSVAKAPKRTVRCS